MKFATLAIFFPTVANALSWENCEEEGNMLVHYPNRYSFALGHATREMEARMKCPEGTRKEMYKCETRCISQENFDKCHRTDKNGGILGPSYCRRAGTGSKWAVKYVMSESVTCDASKCKDWDCNTWCKCFNHLDEEDKVYEEYTCAGDDDDGACECTVKYEHPFKNKRKPRSCHTCKGVTCGTNFFKGTPGRPAFDGTGCEMCTDWTQDCDTESNKIIPCTETEDAKCEPKQT